MKIKATKAKDSPTGKASVALELETQAERSLLQTLLDTRARAFGQIEIDGVPMTSVAKDLLDRFVKACEEAEAP